MNSKKLILMVCAGSMAAWPGNSATNSTATMSGPVTGYVFDTQAHAIRPMMGIPGAAYLGAPILYGLDSASVSPDGSAALAVHGGRLALYQGLRSAKQVDVPLDGDMAVDYFAWAPSGTAAAVYSSAAKQAQVFGNLLAASPAGVSIDLSGLAGQVTAISYDGQRMILAVSSANGGGIYIMTPQSAPRLIASAVSPLAIVLAGADLYFADSQAQQIWQVRSYATQPAAVVFAADTSISSPTALQISAGGARLYVANAGNNTLGVYDLASRSSLQTLPLNFTPAALDRFGDASVFLLNTRSEGNGLWYVLADQLGRRAVYFVPDKGGSMRPPLHYKPL